MNGFGNTMSSVSSKVVSFNIRKGHSHPSEEVAKKEHVTPLEVSLMDVAEHIMSVQEHQRYMNTRERLHRNTEESTNDRVKWFSILEFIVLLVTNVYQIVSLKAFSSSDVHCNVFAGHSRPRSLAFCWHQSPSATSIHDTRKDAYIVVYVFPSNN